MKLFISLVIMVSMFIPGFISADEQKGSITLTCFIKEKQGDEYHNVPLSNFKYNVYQVYTLTNVHPDLQHGEIVYNDKYKNLIEMSADMNAAQLQEAIDKFVEASKTDSPKTVLTTNLEGITKAEDLEFGGYLFVQSEPLIWKGNKYTCLPFLVTIPYKQPNGSIVTDVNITPKPGIEVDDEKIHISGEKKWVEVDDLPAEAEIKEITIRLFADNEEVATTVANESTNWKYQFADLPKYSEKTKQPITYRCTEDLEEGWEVEYDGFTIINKYKPSTTSINVIKYWDDNFNMDDTRPYSITVYLLANGVRTGASLELTGDEFNPWVGAFTNLPVKDSAGNIIKYSVEETPVEFYEVEYDDSNQVVGIFINNKYVPFFPKTGDETNIIVWISLLAISTIAGIVILIVSRKRDKKDNK